MKLTLVPFYPCTYKLPNLIYFHQQSPQDDPFVRVLPEASYLYQYEIDGDQPAGTYWYHPHTHGSTHFQVYMLLIKNKELILSFVCRLEDITYLLTHLLFLHCKIQILTLNLGVFRSAQIEQKGKLLKCFLV